MATRQRRGSRLPSRRGSSFLDSVHESEIALRASDRKRELSVLVSDRQIPSSLRALETIQDSPRKSVHGLSQGSKCWVPDDELGFCVGTVENIVDGQFYVKLEDGEKDAQVKKFGLLQVHTYLDYKREEIEDLIRLDDLHEPSMLDTVRLKFEADLIYTYIGSILLAVNPYKDLGLYSEDKVKEYQGKKLLELPPHVFALADLAYHAAREGEAQSVYISGESGAGKTEAAKQVLQFLASSSQGSMGGIAEQILQSGPILEAFGNAKTVRNNNSSRYGKYFEVQFDAEGHIAGGKINSYLLEKSRVVFCAEGERNYHSFYQLCAGSEDLIPGYDSLKLSKAEDFHYLRQGNCFVNEDLPDQDGLHHMLHGMDVIGLALDKKMALFRLLAAILHLGNVQFTSNDKDGAVVKDEDVAHPASLLSVEPEQLKQSLISRSIVMMKEVVVTPLTVPQAVASRDALAKALYSAVFNWLIGFINKTVAVDTSHCFIGVLDIFGFEVFESNSFEQFCINMANERLQQYFVQHVFKLEQSLYEQEGIQWDHIAFTDNQQCIDIMELKGTGLVSMLDEECRMVNGSDENFLDKINNQWEKDAYFEKNKKKGTIFTLKHYAGDVVYDITGWLEKNADVVYDDLVKVVHSSKDEPLREMFQETYPEESDKKAKKQSVAHQFRSQLDDLLYKLSQTVPTYIRCIKPNSFKKADAFDPMNVLRQLRYAGVLDTIKVRRGGYAIRMDLQDFVNSYGLLLQGEKVASLPDKAEKILMAVHLDVEAAAVGKSKIFLKEDAQDELENSLHAMRAGAATHIQKMVRGRKERQVYLKMRVKVIVCQSLTRRLLAVRQRKQLKHERDSKAALKIQCGARGMKARKELRQLRSMRHAAIVLQAKGRMLALRKKYKHTRESAIKIQSMARTIAPKKELAVLKKENEERLKKEEEERKAKEEEERRIREEEERKAKEEEERRAKEEEERKAKEEEERKAKEEEERKAKEEADKAAKEEEERKAKEEEERKAKEEEERKAKEEADEAAKEEEERKAKEEEERKAKEEEERKAKEEEERKAKEEADKAAKEEEERRAKEEEERKASEAEAQARKADDDAADDDEVDLPHRPSTNPSPPKTDVPPVPLAGIPPPPPPDCSSPAATTTTAADDTAAEPGGETKDGGEEDPFDFFSDEVAPEVTRPSIISRTSIDAEGVAPPSLDPPSKKQAPMLAQLKGSDAEMSQMILMKTDEANIAQEIEKYDSIKHILLPTNVFKNIARRVDLKAVEMQSSDGTALVDCLKNNSSNVDALVVVLKIVQLLITAPVNITTFARQADGIPALLVALGSNNDNADVVTRICRIIAHLAFNNDDLMVVIAKKRGVQTIVAGMDNFKEQSEVLRTCVSALRNMSVRNQLNQALIAKSGAMSSVLQAMKDHPQSTKLVTDSLGLLVNISGNPEGADLMVKEGALDLALQALQFHSANHDIAEHAVSIFVNVTGDEEDEVMSTRMVNVGVVDAVLEVLHKQDISKKVQEYSMLFLGNLSASELAVHRMMEKGVVMRLLQIVNENKSELILLGAAVRTLGNLAISEDYVNTIVRSNGTHIVVDIMKANMTVPELLEICILLLGNLAVVETNVDLIVYEGGIDVIMEAMKHHPTNIETLYESFTTLRNLSFEHDDIREQIVKTGAPDLIMLSAEAFNDNKDFVENARATLEVLGVEHTLGDGDGASTARGSTPGQDGTAHRDSDILRDVVDVLSQMLVEGGLFTKHNKKGFPRQRHVRYIPEMRSICWVNPNKMEVMLDSIPVSYVTEVRKGTGTKALGRTVFGGKKDRCFSIIADHRTLDLECANAEECDQWVAAFDYLRENYDVIDLKSVLPIPTQS